MQTKFLLLFILAFSFQSYGQDNLFSKVFGNLEYEGTVKLKLHDKSLGDFNIKLEGEKVTKIESEKLKLKLAVLLKPIKFKQIKFTKEWLALDKLPYKVEYDSQKLILKIKIPVTHLSPKFYSMDNNPHIKFLGEAINPAPFGGSVGYTFDKVKGSEFFGGDSTSLNYDSFINLNGFVFEQSGYYFDSEDDTDAYWFRGDTRLTKDILKFRTRLTLGDTYSSGFGFMRGESIGGISIKKEFSTSPYNKPYPQGKREFSLSSRSRVRTYVNGTIIKDELLPPGNYQLRNLPLINGFNFVRLEIINDIGQIRYKEFELSTSISVLKEGEVDFSLTSGQRIEDEKDKRNYIGEGITNGHIQYGFSDRFTAGVYGQSESEYKLAGLELGRVFKYGNVFVEGSFSNNSGTEQKGSAYALSWQYQNIGGELLKGSSLTARYEYYVNEYRSSTAINDRSLKDSINLNISFPPLSRLSLSIGGGVSSYQDESLSKRKIMNATLNWRVKNNLSFNLYGSSVESSDVKSETIAAFMTWSFDGSDKYVTAYRDFSNNSTQVTLTKDNQNRLYNSMYSISGGENEQARRIDGKYLYPTPMMDFELRGSQAKDIRDEEDYSQVGLKLSSSILFAYGESFAFAMARPNHGSFALFKRSEELKSEKVRLQSSSPFADTESPVLGDLALTNLVPYQYREVEIDPTFLTDGISLEKESFVLLPLLKSAHVIELKDKGIISIKGKLVTDSGPLKLKVGRVGSNVFFTDRAGNFFIEGIKSKNIVIEVYGYKKYEVQIDKLQKGIIQLEGIKLVKENL